MYFYGVERLFLIHRERALETVRGDLARCAAAILRCTWFGSLSSALLVAETLALLLSRSRSGGFACCVTFLPAFEHFGQLLPIPYLPVGRAILTSLKGLPPGSSPACRL